ncbi:MULTISPECIES: GNAT family N-acetyltransferase [Leuconostoc]|uniref:GNAT family N-acetyltransferase n=1 Tax=Leuconostoc kimchii TaxID=136609 RepID=A0ABX5SM24_9LACO|nr:MULTISPECIES: GNAT family N-acetyltransferase [Leuconostoc]AEJ31910.1 acetyltransferase (putative) [Leuconostoc sp. C2]QBR48409.1 GNAT family N-acetyltransferase [Leuconostoc kimchii]
MSNQTTILQNKFLKLRAMQPNDSDELARIYLDDRVNYFPWVKQPKLTDFGLAILGEKVEIAMLDTEIVGFASLSEWDSFLHLLFIKEGKHNQGIGAVLLNWARETAQQPLELKVVTDNKNAQRFYEREGFSIVAHSNLSKPRNVTYRDDRNS